ncbi:MFS transporter [Actinophytocola algeriensis]|uniref:Putative MFS family arabinose efflux permease n=1 Tax=Actinophytocola algeriensis TaxID=1768010 RepID=A0A7W7Q4S5_9PSEU|nr:MFS transporter [Actinophytocola algeriensis]MBB4906828.1 putative MFS family arabinose efflux permease [Actinophytocola algeriensis]MBE1478309.1 putative MFS family arabinose efflux permease [Actinophytocola algeriensis]
MYLFALTLAAFAVQTDDFVIIGVLPAIAADLGVSTGAAGQLVTVFTLVYALAAPLSAALLGRLDRRTLLAGALILFCAANFVVPLVDSYPLLMALRVVAALAAATVLPAALALATHLAPEGATGRHLATVMAGMTGAIVLGVPAGTWVGAAFGWRATFVLGGALGALGLLALLTWLPRTTLDRPPSPRGLLTAPVLKVLAVTVAAVAGNLAFQTYLATFLAGLSGVTPAVLGVLLVVAGLAGIAGARLAGTVIDRIGAHRAFAAAAAVFALVMAVFAVVWSARPVPLWLTVPLLVVWSAAAWAVPPAIQALMLARAGQEHATAAMAVVSSTVYLGAAAGGAAGGLLVGMSPGAVPVFAAACALVAVGLSRT